MYDPLRHIGVNKQLTNIGNAFRIICKRLGDLIRYIMLTCISYVPIEIFKRIYYTQVS